MTTVRVDRPREGIVRLTLDRPDNANSINGALIADLASAVQGLASQARVAVITGEGRFFCAGADLKEVGAADASWIWSVRETFERIEGSPIPVIAAINGTCMGGGTELALACDFRIAARGVKIGLPEIRFGALPAAGGPNRLARLVGPSTAKKLVMTGAHLTVEEAASIGLVDEVADDLEARSLELAEAIAAHAPYAVRATKFIIDRGSGLPLSEALRLEYQVIDHMATPEERQAEIKRAMERNTTYKKIFSQAKESPGE